MQAVPGKKIYREREWLNSFSGWLEAPSLSRQNFKIVGTKEKLVSIMEI